MVSTGRSIKDVHVYTYRYKNYNNLQSSFNWNIILILKTIACTCSFGAFAVEFCALILIHISKHNIQMVMSFSIKLERLTTPQPAHWSLSTTLHLYSVNTFSSFMYSLLKKSNNSVVPAWNHCDDNLQTLRIVFCNQKDYWNYRKMNKNIAFYN